MNRLSVEKRALIINLLTEGNSIRGIARIIGCSKNTVTKLLVDAGRVAAHYQDKTMRNLKLRRVECDEIWSFVYAKKENLPQAQQPPARAGDVWTWVAICPDTKLVPAWWVGDRTIDTAELFMNDLAARLANPVRLVTDGHQPYLEAVEGAFGNQVDHRILRKRYPKHPLDISTTAHVERQNLTMRMSIRRMARRTNAFSKKVENHAHMMALYYLVYNFARRHRSLPGRATPAMAAGVTSQIWAFEDIVRLIDEPN